ncbi:MAG: hypothetical protein JOY78_01200 [Pseudonocardia sp.]|nr:hypothetical protein [Pseudonocardia sp.]
MTPRTRCGSGRCRPTTATSSTTTTGAHDEIVRTPAGLRIRRRRAEIRARKFFD